MFIAQWQGQITPGENILTVTETFYYFNYTL